MSVSIVRTNGRGFHRVSLLFLCRCCCCCLHLPFFYWPPTHFPGFHWFSARSEPSRFSMGNWLISVSFSFLFFLFFFFFTLHTQEKGNVPYFFLVYRLPIGRGRVVFVAGLSLAVVRRRSSFSVISLDGKAIWWFWIGSISPTNQHQRMGFLEWLLVKFFCGFVNKVSEWIDLSSLWESMHFLYFQMEFLGQCFRSGRRRVVLRFPVRFFYSLVGWLVCLFVCFSLAGPFHRSEFHL